MSASNDEQTEDLTSVPPFEKSSGDTTSLPPFDGRAVDKNIDTAQQDITNGFSPGDGGVTEKVEDPTGENTNEDGITIEPCRTSNDTVTQKKSNTSVTETEQSLEIDPSTIKEPDPDTTTETKQDDNESVDGWVDILGSGSLRKKVIKKGNGERTRPFSGCVVTICIEGKLDNGVVVDHNKELKFTLGDGDVIYALDLAVPLMELEEQAEVFTEARFAYGEIGREPDIPKDASITYNIEILRVDNPTDISTLSASEKYTLGDEKRERGNYLYSRGEYSSAINSYKKALTILEDDTTNSEAEPSQLQQLIDTRVKCYSNLAASQLKIEAHDAAIRSCDSVLNIHPQNIKALFRKGKAWAAKGETTDAITILRKALSLEPESKILHVELSKLVSKRKKEQDKAKAMYRKMLGTDQVDSPYAKSTDTWLTKWGLVLGASAAVLMSVGVAAYKYRLFP